MRIFAYAYLGDIIKAYIDGINISYNCVGEGLPIVLLHGWGANKNTFNALSNYLSDRFKVYSIDLPGFGETEIGLPFNVYEVSDIVKHFCDSLNIDNPILLGHSYGGRIAIIYASKYKVNRLVLVSAAGIREPLNLNKQIRIKLYKLLKKHHINFKMGSKDYVDADNVKRKMLVDAVNSDLTIEMNKIEADTLLIYGKNDKTTPIDLGKKIEANIKNSALVTIDDAEHFPYLDQPTIFKLILDSFLVGA
ncbi:MAG: alpha/beta hydrolase [Erysipelotrichaceae bacterium]|nr:alpha/beta hydrolase [Erysipelotrichaceae bacterium]